MQPFDRRSFIAFLGAAAAVSLTSHEARAAAPVEGRDYELVNPAQPATDSAHVVVTEFFSYQCAHCAAFAPSFAAWVKALPADVRVERVPVSLGRPAWEPAGRAYLALVAMNSVEKVDAALFAAIHQQGVRLDTEAQITGWLGKQGIDTGAFTGMYRSFGIDAQYRSSDGKARALRVDGTPTLVIDGRYRIAIEDIGAGREQHYRTQLAVASELIAKARQQRAPAASKAGKAATRQAINLSAS